MKSEMEFVFTAKGLVAKNGGAYYVVLDFDDDGRNIRRIVRRCPSMTDRRDAIRVNKDGQFVWSQNRWVNVPMAAFAY